MTSILQKSTQDKKKRLALQSSEIERRYYKMLRIQSRRLGVIPLITLAKITYKNHCIVSGKTHSIYSKPFKLSRHVIKKHFNKLFGLKTSSW